MSSHPTATDIRMAKSAFPDIVKHTAVERSARLSTLYNAEVYLKREDQQVVRSYKIRGAYNRMYQLSDEEKQRGVVTASAGNHAQGVALTCRTLQISGAIFMPITTPQQKVDATQAHGGEWVTIQLVGDTFDEASAAARTYQQEQGATFVHAFDHAHTIAGQGTVGLEVLADLHTPIDYLFGPLGGGGVMSGISTYFKEVSPQTKLIGVEPLEAPAMCDSIEAGERVVLDHISTFVDGAAMRQIGELTFEIIQQNLDACVRVPQDRLCTTMLQLLNKDGIIAEPAGALSIDALQDYKDQIQGKTVVCLVSGGNLDFQRLPEIKERSMKYEGLKKYIVVNFPQRPGALGEFLSVLGQNDDIVRFEYLKKTAKESGPALIGLETTVKGSLELVFEKLNKKCIQFRDITHDQMFFDLLV